MMESEYWKSFYLGGEKLYAYPLKGDSDETHLATLEYLAHKHRCQPRDITVYLEECRPKQWDFKRDCSYEHIGQVHGIDRWRILSVCTGRLYTHKGALSEFIAKYEAGEAC